MTPRIEVRIGPRARRQVVLLAIGLALAAGSAPAQEAASVSASPWYWAWTPLRPIGGVGLPAPVAPAPVAAPGLPRPAIGLLWTASNPAALVTDGRAAWSQVTAMTGSVDGDYRNPLATPHGSATGVELAGWRPVGGNGAAIGRAAVERAAIGSGGRGLLLAPDASSPIVPADSNAPSSTRTRVTLEGATAVRARAWSFGLALAYEGTSDHADQAAVALARRSTTTGATLGLVRAIGGAARWGLILRHREHTETVNLFPNPGAAVVYPLDGYLGVAADVYSLGGSEPFVRRVDESADAVGIGAAGGTPRLSWVAYANADRSRQRQLRGYSPTFPSAAWSADGWSAGASTQFTRGNVLTTLRANLIGQRGAERAAFGSPGHFRSSTAAMYVAGDLQWRPAGSAWQVATTFGAGRTRYVATDSTARVAVEVSAWNPSVAASLTRAAGDGYWAVGYGADRYIPFATIPPTGTRGPAYLTLVAPAIEMAAAPALSHALWLDRAFTWGTARSMVRLSWATTAPTRRAADAAALPSGSRTRWAISLSLSPP